MSEPAFNIDIDDIFADAEDRIAGDTPQDGLRTALDIFDPKPDPYLADPHKWVEDKLGEYLWTKQVEIMESVRDNRRTAVRSCHGPGKSFTAARTVAWWLDVHPLGTAFAVTTAPSWQQVEAILWREMRRAHRIGKLRGRISLDCEWRMGTTQKRGGTDEELIAYGRKPSDYNEQAFQGIHARYVLIVIDEACGVPANLYDACETLMTNDFARILAIGNPDDPATRFAEINQENSIWNVIKISAWDTPNFTGEWIPEDLRQDLTSELWVEERRRTWGEGSPLWTSKVEAEFPEVSEDTLISPALLRRATETNLPGTEKGRYGLDVARFGDDFSCLYRNRGGQIRRHDAWSKRDTVESVRRVTPVLDAHGMARVPIVVDAIGLGAGVYDMLKHMGYNVAPFQGSERAFRPDRFRNRRSEVYWTFRELLQDGAVDLDPKDEDLLAQLGSIKYWIDSAGRVVLETREEMRERNFPSPDRADACVLTTVAPDVSPADLLGSGRQAVTGDLMTKAM